MFVVFKFIQGVLFPQAKAGFFATRERVYTKRGEEARVVDVGRYFYYLVTVYLHGVGDNGGYFRFQGTMYLNGWSQSQWPKFLLPNNNNSVIVCSSVSCGVVHGGYFCKLATVHLESEGERP